MFHAFGRHRTGARPRVVLELGCEWGATSRLLAERARAAHPDIRFELADGATVVYLDLSGFSGYRSLLDVIALVQMYAVVLRPRLIVAKSGALKHFASRCEAWRGT